MKAIVLAAGKGTRMGPYTEDLPKGMLPLNGKPVLWYTIQAFSECDIDDIIIVRGYKPEKIDFPGIKYYVNEEYSKTNMVESLLCAEDEMDEGFVLSYSDILFEPRVLRGLLDFDADVAVTVDMLWKDYWKARYGKVDYDVESLSMGPDGGIVQLGTPDVDPGTVDGRYVGLLKFSRRGAEQLREAYHEAKANFWNRPWQQSGKTFQNAYMTDILQELIDRGVQVKAYKIGGGWLEFDTVEDYELATKWLDAGTLERFYKVNRMGGG